MRVRPVGDRVPSASNAYQEVVAVGVGLVGVQAARTGHGGAEFTGEDLVTQALRGPHLVAV